jgi:hypothetical protein
MRVLLEMKQQIYWQEQDLNTEHPFTGPETACGTSTGVAN